MNTDPYRLRNLGKLHADRDSEEGFREAVRHFRRLVSLDSATADDRLNLVKALFLAGDVAAAAAEIEELRKVLGDRDPPADFYYLAGLCHKRQGRFEDALAAFRRVTELRPDEVLAWFQCGETEEQLGRFEAAETGYRRALAVAPEHRPATYRLAMVLKRLGREEDFRSVIARFRALTGGGAGETERCGLTEVTRRPVVNRREETPPAPLSWRDIGGRLRGLAALEDVLRVVADRDEADGSVSLLLLGPHGLRRLDPRAPGRGPVPLPVRTEFDDPGRPGPAVMDARTADLDNDGYRDLLALTDRGARLLRGSAEGYGAAQPLAGAESVLPLGAELLDLDHDGDLDIVILTGHAGAKRGGWLRNNGDLSFAALWPFGDADLSRIAAGPRRQIAAHDLDQANDLDLVIAGGTEGVQAFLNLRDGTFHREGVSLPGERTIVLVEDLDGDGAPDVLAAGGSPGWTFASNADPPGEPGRFRLREPRAFMAGPLGVARDADLADLDLDGDLDAVLALEAGIMILRNTGAQPFGKDAAALVPLADGARCVLAEDVADDALPEILVCTDGGGLLVLSSGLKPVPPSLLVLPEGGRDNRDAIGAVVELFTRGGYRSRMVKRPGGLRFGLAGETLDDVDGLRVRWPQGIVQSLPAGELAIDAGGRVRFRQKEGLVASCPFLYARRRDGWRFLGDILGMAPLDEWRPPGQPAHLDPEEFVRLEGRALEEVEGVLRLAVTEELRETAYLDRLELLVVEHPLDVEVFVDESTAQSAYGPLELHVVSDGSLRSPGVVRADGARDPAAAVRERDGVYLHGYEEVRPQWAGWVERYSIDFACSTATSALLLTGRVAWYDSTVVYSLAQHGRGWGPLRLEQVDHAGEASLLATDLGVPAGMDRTMVHVLAGGPLPQGSRLRLSGQHRFLWDRIQVAASLETATVEPGRSVGLADGRALRCRRLPLERARLEFRGLSATIGNARRHEQSYEYAEATPDGSFAPATGRATRHGEVTTLLEEHDDRLVVLVTGDGLVADFSPGDLPEANRRTFFLRVSGWAKEGSFHNRTGREIGPLPTRGMSRYPPPPGESRRDAEYMDYLRTYQTREVRRRTP